jgi:hypothetical protein
MVTARSRRTRSCRSGAEAAPSAQHLRRNWYVVSGSLSQADATWRGEHPDIARLVTGDVAAAVQALKDEPGDELQIWGSGTLLQRLLQHGSSTASA